MEAKDIMPSEGEILFEAAMLMSWEMVPFQNIPSRLIFQIAA